MIYRKPVNEAKQLRLFLIILLALITLGGSACKKTEPADDNSDIENKTKVNEIMSSAYSLFKNSNYALAEEKAAAALAINPNMVDAELLRARALLHLKREKDAIAAYNRALAIDPEGLSALLDARVLLKKTGKLKEVIEMYRASIEKEPDSGLIYINLGLALETDGQQEEALAAIQKGAELAPKNARAQFELGRAFLRLGRTAEALTAFAKAVEVDPEMMDARFEYARLLEHLGKQEEAMAEYKLIAEKNPNDESALIALGTALGKQGDYHEAAETLKKAVELNPFSLAAANNLARAQMEFDVDAAIKTLTIHSERLADKPERVHELAKVYVGLAICLRKKDKTDEGFDYLKKAAQLMPSDLLILRQLAVYAGEAGKRTDEIDALKLFVEKAAGQNYLENEVQKSKVRLVELGAATSLE